MFSTLTACPKKRLHYSNDDHNNAIDEHLQSAKDQGASDIRKNQVQVDKDGSRVGNNVPDAQYNLNDEHHVYEVDRNVANSDKHVNTIKNNDPNAVVHTDILPKK